MSTAGKYFSRRNGLRDFMEAGPYAPILEAWAQELEQKGYSASTINGYLKGARHLTWCLEHRVLYRRDLTPEGLRNFALRVHEVCRCPYRVRPSANMWSAMKHMVPVLRAAGLAPPEREEPFGAELAAYKVYLEEERGLAGDTVQTWLRSLALSLKTLMPRGRFAPDRLSAPAINAYILGIVEAGHLTKARHAASVLRGFCRYLQVGGLASHVDPKAIRGPKYSWKGTSAKALTREQLKQLFAPLKERTVKAVRDTAILLLIGRTGLRRSDVSRRTLDDFKGRAGTLVVGKNKSRREHEVPVPRDARDAILEYVRHFRPKTSSNALFLTLAHPYDAGISPGGVGAVVTRAFRRAGIDHPSKGVHVLRHTLATQLVAGKAPLKAVADVLVHELIDTTVRYTNVDQGRLKAATRPWGSSQQQEGSHGHV